MFLSKGLLVTTGFVAVSINYRLTGKFWGVDPSNASTCCPGIASDQYARDASHDLKAAIRFMRKNADAWGVDTSRIGISGGSAGAVTVLFTGYVPVGEVNSTSNLSLPVIYGNLSIHIFHISL